ncbi:MAG: tetratricopeptide repeat protein [Candidatus Rokubacteria bacterium]|nr:tetratricopeptide repeat protein [Candidatus Rokubacteria bacterium]
MASSPFPDSLGEAEALLILRGDDPARAARAAEALWARWHRSGEPGVDALLRDGILAMQRQDHPAAEDIFTRIIARAPGFAEGWNKRATVRYLAENYAGSIADCEETLAHNPNHFGALSGQGLCHMAIGQYREAAALFRRALAVHPHLENARANLRTALAEVVKWN